MVSHLLGSNVKKTICLALLLNLACADGRCGAIVFDFACFLYRRFKSRFKYYKFMGAGAGWSKCYVLNCENFVFPGEPMFFRENPYMVGRTLIPKNEV